MIHAWLSPEKKIDLRGEVAQRASALHAAATTGARFLALPVEDTKDATSWILASFFSPVTVVPLSPRLPEAILEHRLVQLPKHSVIFPSSLAIPATISAMPERRSLQEIWAVIFTSGSSGDPKGIAVSGEALQASALAHAEHSKAAGATWLLDLPLFHIGGLSILSRALFLESSIAIGATRFDAAATTSWISSGKVQGLSLVPTTLFRLLQPGIDFSNLELILLGGAAAEEGLVSGARKRGAPVRLTYGMTEHASQIATERKPGEGLEALPGVEIKLARDGEILVRSKCLASGFFRDGALTELPLQEGFFATGDLGEFRGNKLHLLGRKSELIVSGGKKTFPQSVEQALLKIPGVRDCGVSSIPDPEWGEIICAAVVEEKPGAFDWAEARAKLSFNLESYQHPKRWTLVDSIPRSPTGKMLRPELQKLVREKFIPNRN